MAATLENSLRLLPQEYTYSFRQSPAGKDMPSQWHEDIEFFQALREDSGWRGAHGKEFAAVKDGYAIIALTYESLIKEVSSKIGSDTPVFMVSIEAEKYTERLRIHRHLA